MKTKVPQSYVRLVVIAIVLGVVAKMVVPQLTQASTEDKVSALVDALVAVRSHIDLYRTCHGRNLPPGESSAGFEQAIVTEDVGYKPFLKRIPVNPFNGLDTVRFDGAPAGAGHAGWRFDTKTGLFQADNSAVHAAL